MQSTELSKPGFLLIRIEKNSEIFSKKIKSVPVNPRCRPWVLSDSWQQLKVCSYSPEDLLKSHRMLCHKERETVSGLWRDFTVLEGAA